MNGLIKETTSFKEPGISVRYAVRPDARSISTTTPIETLEMSQMLIWSACVLTATICFITNRRFLMDRTRKKVNLIGVGNGKREKDLELRRCDIHREDLFHFTGVLE